MVRLLFLVPLIMCLGWFFYLKKHGWTITQGKKGFVYIIIFNAVLALTLWGIMLLTNR